MKNLRLFAVTLSVAAGMAALADQPFRDHRYDSFKATPTESGQIVFAGNSITNMHSWFEAFGSNQEVIGRGNSGGFAYEMLNELENYIDGKPAKFFVMIGTNDISSGQSAEITARRIQTIVKRVRLESPETEVYVESILPRSANPKPDYENCNTMVREWVESLNDPKVQFINLSTVCAGLNGNSTWSHDGLHPRPIGYAAWTHAIETQVGHTSVYPEEVTTQQSCGLSGSHAARAEQFPYFPVSEGDVLFYGDEQVHGGEWHELFRSNKIKDRGTGWGWGGIALSNAKQVVKYSLSDQASKPAKIFLFYGIGGTAKTAYNNIIDEAKSQAPDAKIYLVSLSPSADATTDAARVTFNEFLQSAAEEKGATYVDVYTPLKADINLNIMGTNYISGRGYVVMANAIAPYLQEEGVNPVSLEEYDALYARRTARKIIGDALTNAMMLNFGPGLGQLSTEKQAEIEAAYPELVRVVNDPELTVEKANEAIAFINEAVAAARGSLNMPQASTDGNEVWYTLTSARGTASTLTVSDGKLIGAAMPGDVTAGANVWKFIDRGDDTYNIVNGAGEYISPVATHDTQMSVNAAEPSTGFTLSHSNAANGAYVIYTSSCQLNQTSIQSKVYNWYGTSTPNRDDLGCAYYISLYEGTIGEPEPVAVPEPVATLLDIECDGGEPFRLPDHLAAPILDSTSNTVAFSVTVDESTTPFAAFAAASSPDATEFYCVGRISDDRYGVRFIGAQGSEGWYTRNITGTPEELKFVVVNDATDGLTVYANNNQLMQFAPSAFAAYAHKHFGNVDNSDSIYLGAFATADDECKYPLIGTIHSVRFWDSALTPEQVASLSYEGLVASDMDSISEISADKTPGKQGIYDLQGRRVTDPAHGLYIVDGQKMRL